MKRCEFQGGAGLEEKFRPPVPCLGEFEPRPQLAWIQKFCKVCAPFAHKWHLAQYHLQHPEQWKASLRQPRKCRRCGKDLTVGTPYRACAACRKIDRDRRSIEFLSPWELKALRKRQRKAAKKFRENHRAEINQATNREREDIRQIVAKVKAGELVSAPTIDRERVALVARLELDGLKEAREMADEVYPPDPSIAGLTERDKKADRAKRVDRTKKFLRRNRKRIDIEKERLAAADRAASTSMAS